MGGSTFATCVDSESTKTRYLVPGIAKVVAIELLRQNKPDLTGVAGFFAQGSGLPHKPLVCLRYRINGRSSTDVRIAAYVAVHT